MAWLDESPPIATSFVQTGRLDRATKIGGIFSRFHSRKYLFEGNEFYKNFEDSERKWKANDRYAAPEISCGHFFGCSQGATQAEAQSYGLNTKDSAFLEVEMSLDGLLDLTYEENIDWLFSHIFENPETLGRSYFVKLIELIHHQHGGDEVNEFAGLAARNREYDGVIFFGARALRKHEKAWQTNPGDPLIYMIEQLAFPQMRADRTLQNIVAFYGPLVTRSVRRYRIDESEWKDNPFFQIGEAELDRILEFPADFQYGLGGHIITRKIQRVPAVDRKEVIRF